MDDARLEPGMHRAALRGLDRVGAVSFTERQVWHAIRSRLSAGHNSMDYQAAPRQSRGLHDGTNSEQLEILDLACGSGALALGLARRAQHAGIAVCVEGCDVSPLAVEVARERSAAEDIDATFYGLDVIGDELPRQYDIVVTSLFLHHLDDAQSVAVLRKMAAAARIGIVVSDLLRTRLGYTYAWLGTRVLSRSPIVYVDGPRSVKRAFSLAEARRLADEAGLLGANVKRTWPQRFLLTWWRS